MKVIGIQRVNYVSKSGREVNGVKFFLSSPIDEKLGSGVSCEDVYFSYPFLDDFTGAVSLGDDVKPIYNRYGRCESLTPVE